MKALWANKNIGPAVPAVLPAVGTGLLQRKCGACGNQTVTGSSCKSCEDKNGVLQRQTSNGLNSSGVPAIVHDVLRSPGRLLDAPTRAFFEPRFAHNFSRVPVSSAAQSISAKSLAIGEPSSAFELEADRMADAIISSRGSSGGSSSGETFTSGGANNNFDLSGVRIHTGAQAAESAKAINARAYTVGSDIVFGEGQFSPGTTEGKKLIAHELTHVTQQNTGQVQRSILGSIGNFFVGIGKTIARFFGSENYSKEELDAYLQTVTTANQIEGNYDSDNKARAVVGRQGEFPPLTTAVKTVLIREMLKGATLGADEEAILQLLRAAATDERKAMVAGIGREVLWDNFGGENFRSLEAITLTAEDFTRPALVERLKGLSRGQLTQYKDQALDSDVKTNIEKILGMQNITTPLGMEANFTSGGTASLVINGLEVTILPDIYNAPITKDMAFTVIGISATSPQKILIDSETKKIVSFDPPKMTADIQTKYSGGLSESETDKQLYGRGTTSEDKNAGNTSIKFHESRHGLSAFEFFRNNPAPVFTGKVGMSMEEFTKAADDYLKEVTDYAKRQQTYNMQLTDCPGNPIGEEYLKGVGASTTICTDLRKKKK